MECSICLDPVLSNKCETICNHVYHSSCIFTWIQISNKCPMCNAAVCERIKVIQPTNAPYTQETQNRIPTVAGVDFLSWLRGEGTRIVSSSIARSRRENAISQDRNQQSNASQIRTRNRTTSQTRICILRLVYRIRRRNRERNTIVPNTIYS